MEEEQILFEPKLDEHFSKSKLWLFSKNVATDYVNYNNISNNKRRNISIPIVDDDLIYCPNNRF